MIRLSENLPLGLSYPTHAAYLTPPLASRSPMLRRSCTHIVANRLLLKSTYHQVPDPKLTERSLSCYTHYSS